MAVNGLMEEKSMQYNKRKCDYCLNRVLRMNNLPCRALNVANMHAIFVCYCCYIESCANISSVDESIISDM